MPRRAMRSALVVLLLLALSGCRTLRQIELVVPAKSKGAQPVVVKVGVPKDWRPLPPSASRIEFLAPDNRSRAYFRVMRSEVDDQRCPATAKRYAQDVIDSWGGPPRTELFSLRDRGALVDFELRRKDPEPAGEVIWSRVVCRQGGLVVASCTLPTTQVPELGETCGEVLESIDVSSRPLPRG